MTEPGQNYQNGVAEGKAGSIIIFHDGKGVYRNATRLGTIAAIGRIITALKREGYAFVRVSDISH